MIILLFIILFYHFLYGSLISIFIDGKSCDLCETAGFVVKVPFPRRKKGVQRIITWILRNRSKGQPAVIGDDFHRSALLGE